MARKAKEGTIDLYYLNSNNKKEEKKTRAKHSPSRNKRGKRAKSNSKENNDTFNFDNEIVIGINVLPEKEKNKSNTKKKKTNKLNSKKNTNKKVANKKTSNKKNKKANSKEESDKFDFDNEIVIGVNVLPNQEENKKQKSNKKKNNSKNNNKSNNKNNSKAKEAQNTDKHLRNYKKAKLILKIFLILALFTGVIVFLVTSPLFNIKTINVNGNNKVSTEQVISLSQIELETNIYKIITAQVESNIKENTYIDTVAIKRKLPNEINITITERKPQYMLKYGNAYVYLSSQGYMLEISEEKLELPIISGYTTIEEELKEGNRLNNVDLNKLEVVLKIMESATNNDIAAYISEINISDENNYTLVFESKGKTAYLGTPTNINDKIIVLKQMIIKAEGQNGEAFLMDKDKMYFREE